MDKLRNDLLRKALPLIKHPNIAALTCGVMALGEDAVADIIEKVRNFNEFTPDNDPWGEHDFGSFDYKGQKIFWKIDDYHGHDGYELVLTIMLAEEY